MNVSLCRIAAKMYPVSYPSSSSSSMGTGRSQVSSWVILEIRLVEFPPGGVLVDSVGVVTSFTLFSPLPLAFAFLALVVWRTASVRILEPAIFGHVANTSAHEATRFRCISFALSLAFAFALLRQGIDLHVIWSPSAESCQCHICLILRVVLQELKSHCRHRLEGSQVLHVKWDSHR